MFQLSNFWLLIVAISGVARAAAAATAPADDGNASPAEIRMNHTEMVASKDREARVGAGGGYKHLCESGQRAEGDLLAYTPWEDFDFHGATDHAVTVQYQAPRGCWINYFYSRNYIPNDSGDCRVLSGGVNYSYMRLSIRARGVDYFYFGVKVYILC